MDNRAAVARMCVGDLWKRLSKGDREQLAIETGRIDERIQRLTNYTKKDLDFEYPFVALTSCSLEDKA